MPVCTGGFTSMHITTKSRGHRFSQIGTDFALYSSVLIRILST